MTAWLTASVRATPWKTRLTLTVMPPVARFPLTNVPFAMYAWLKLIVEPLAIVAPSFRSCGLTGQSVVWSNAGAVPAALYAPDAKSWPERPTEFCFGVSSRPVTWSWIVNSPLSIAPEIVVDGVGKLAALWMIGRMTEPNALSMPLLPSAWFVFGAAAGGVQASVEFFVVVFWSRL